MIAELILLVAAIAGSSGLTQRYVSDHFDMCIYNVVYSETGEITFRQLVFLNWVDTTFQRRGEALIRTSQTPMTQHWVNVGSQRLRERELPTKTSDGRWCVLLDYRTDDSEPSMSGLAYIRSPSLRRITFDAYREEHTLYDIERYEFFPSNKTGRLGLTDLLRKSY